jgi:hypothetical protein
MFVHYEKWSEIKMEINDELQHMITPYINLYGMKNENSKPYYMIAEFIDNSLSSWVENKMTSDLKIDVYHNYNNGILRISDNAFGMDKQQLGNSIQLYDEKVGNVLSMFGVGMKKASFWFGEDLFISTKQDGMPGFKTNITLSDKIDTDEMKKQITWKISQDNEIRNTGTIVTIKNIYKEKLMNKRMINEVLHILSLKYKRYLNKNVRIDFTIERGDEFENYSLNPDTIGAQVIPESEISRFVELITKKKHEFVTITNLADIVINLASERKALEFEYDTVWKGKSLHFLLGIQTQQSGKDKDYRLRYGLMTFQSDRAINIPKVNVIDLGKDYTRTNIKRAYGEIELGEYYKPDNNKREFTFGVDHDEFIKLVKEDIGSDLLTLADIVVEIMKSRDIVKVGNGISNASKIEKSLSMQNEEINWIVSGDTADMSINDFKVRVREISSDNPNHENYFISTTQVKNNEIEVSININHPLWKPLINNQAIDIKKVIYQIAAVLGISFDKASYESAMIAISGEQGVNQSYPQILKTIINYITGAGVDYE